MTHHPRSGPESTTPTVASRARWARDPLAGDALATLAAILGAGDGAPARAPRHLDAARWDQVLRAAGPRDLMPALWTRARRLQLVEPVPPPLVQALGDQRSPRHHPAAVLELAHQRNHVRNQDLLDQLDEVVAALAERGIGVVALKGSAHLVAGTWPDPADRAMSDLDLLIDAGTGPEARAQLEAMGYRATPHPGEELGGHHHLPALHHPERYGAVELHTEVLQRGWRPALDAAAVRADAGMVEWRGHQLGLPSAAHTAVVSLVHGYLADDARYQARVPLRPVHELWRFDREVAPVPWPEVRGALDRIGWASLVDDYAVTTSVLLGDRRSDRSRGMAAARLRLALAAARRTGRPGAIALGDPMLRLRHSLDAGRLRRHYGTELGGPWRLRVHHLARRFPRVRFASGPGRATDR